MRLTHLADYAVVIMTAAARRDAGARLSASELAQETGVPLPTTQKLMGRLAAEGLLTSARGVSGGFALARPAEAITLADIVEAVEGKAQTFVCNNIRANNPCRPHDYCESSPCAVARVMWEADEAWRQKLRSVSFSDLIETLARDIPPDLWKNSSEWVLERAG